MRLRRSGTTGTVGYRIPGRRKRGEVERSLLKELKRHAIPESRLVQGMRPDKVQTCAPSHE